MDLAVVWFVIIAVLWTGFFFLEGFDFGVGMLNRVLGRDDVERRQVLATIGPVWDADEVWLITGGVAIFAAFPAWYAALFPAAYLPLLLVVIGLIVRAVAMEYRSKRSDATWRGRWDMAIAGASGLLALLFGVFWAGIVHGIPLDADGRFVGRSLLSFITLYSLLGGIALLAFTLSHGATFVALKTVGAVQLRASRLAAPLAAITAVLMAAFALWTWAAYSASDVGALAVGLLAAGALVVSVVANLRGAHLIAFWCNGVAIAAYVAGMFIALYPNVLPSTVDPADSLTIAGASASDYSLTIITWVAVIMLPVVIGYQAWSFWVFRKRIARSDV